TGRPSAPTSLHERDGFTVHDVDGHGVLLAGTRNTVALAAVRRTGSKVPACGPVGTFAARSGRSPLLGGSARVHDGPMTSHQDVIDELRMPARDLGHAIPDVWHG